MKKRTIALMLSVLAVLMLVGVGFATWVISQGASTDAQGNIVVDAVTDERVYVEIAKKSGEDDEIVFGHDKSSADPTDWLKNADDDKAENMSCIFVLTVKNREGELTDATTVTPTLQILRPATGEESEPQTVTLPQWVVAQAVAVNHVSTGTYELTVEFKWAAALNPDSSATEGLNPYIYFNGGTSKGTDRMAGLAINAEQHMENNADAALKVLSDIYAIPANTFYKLSVDVAK